MNGAQKSFVISLALLSSYPMLAGVPIHPARGTPHAWGDTS